MKNKHTTHHRSIRGRGFVRGVDLLLRAQAADESESYPKSDSAPKGPEEVMNLAPETPRSQAYSVADKVQAGLVVGR